MGYQMIYQSGKKMPDKRNSLQRQTGIAVCFLVFSVAVRMFWEPGAEMLREYLVPGELSVTEAAFSAFVNDLQQGSAIGTAVEAFCHRVIHGGI